MDKHVSLWAGMIVLGLLVLSETPLMNVFFAFFILGAIPGTDLIIPAWVIFTLYPLIFLVMLYWLFTQPLFIGEPARPTTPPKPVAQKTKKKVALVDAKRTAPKRRARTAV